MQKFRKLWRLLPFLLFPANGLAAELAVKSLGEGAVSPPATIDDADFLAGHWIGEGFGACAEELMATSAGGQIMGMFRLMNADGGVKFYEFYQIAEMGGSLILRIKHFNPDLTGWEEKSESVEFPLVGIEGTTAYFDGLTFSRIGKDVFRSAVAIEGQGVASFEMRKAKAGESC